MVDEKPHRSVSQINTYLNCSEMYRLKYVDKPPIPPAPAAWLAQGTAFHLAAKLWEESGRSELFNIEETFLKAYDEEIRKMKEQQPELKYWLRALSKKTEQDIEERRERGLQQIRDYVIFAEKSKFVVKEIDDYTLSVEVPFLVEFGGIPIKGEIDLILDLGKDGVEVRDLKTGNRESATIQLGTYKVVVEKLFGWKVSKASFYYAKDSKVAEIQQATLDRYTEEYVTDLFQTLDRGIKNKVFIPNPGSQCTLCPVKQFCREWK